jgi:hypothetical protein
MKQPRLKYCKGETKYGEKCHNFVSMGDYCHLHNPLFNQKSSVKSERIKPERTLKTNYHRRYVYPETYKEVMVFAVMQGLHSPNHKDNFPYNLKKYIEYLKQTSPLDIKDMPKPKV